MTTNLPQSEIQPKTQVKDKNGVTLLDKAKNIVDEKKRAEIVKLLEG